MSVAVNNRKSGANVSTNKRKLLDGAAAVNTAPASEAEDHQSKNQKVLLREYFEEAELAHELDVTPRTLRLWRMRRTGPPWGRIGKRVIYRIDGVRTWLADLDKPQRSSRRAA
jgi:hypothetical protein